VQKNKVLTS